MRKAPEINVDSVKRIIIQCILSATLTFFLFIVSTFVLCIFSPESAYINDNSAVLLFAFLAVCSVINGGICALKIKTKALVSSLISSLFFSMLLITAFSLTGKLSFTQNSLISVGIVFLFSAVSSIIIKNIRR